MRRVEGGIFLIQGIGIDLVELPRIEKIILEKPSFVKRVLTPNEATIFASLSARRKIEFLGGRFACKEAYSKALGTGIGSTSFQDIEVLNNDLGAPYVAQSTYDGPIFVSITHTENTAMAQIILEKK